MYCSILITVSQEGDSNLHMQWCQVCTVPFWSQYHKKRIPTYICRGVRYVLFHSDHSITRRGYYICTYIWGVSGMYCSILITVSQEEDSNLHMQGCQVCTVPFWSQYHKKGILTYICRGVRYVLFHSDHSITRRGFQLTYAVVSGMYCSILITVSQEEDSNLHMQGCQVCTVPFWSQYHKKGILTYIFRGVRYVLFHSDQYCDQNGTVHTWHHCICKLESSSCDTVIRMEQYIPVTPEYVSWNPLLVILWSEWNSTYLTPLHM